jgi:hypothetical protein
MYMERAFDPRTFADDLAVRVDVLRQMCDRYLIIDIGANYFVQFMFNPGSVYGEAVSNEYLDCAPGDVSLTVEQETRLVHLGWSVPGELCHPECARPHPNFTRSWSDDVPTADIVADVMRTIVSVYLRGEGDTITFEQARRATRQPQYGKPSH